MTFSSTRTCSYPLKPAGRCSRLVVAGGGFAGVETVAEIADFLHTARRFYRRIQPDDVRVVLVHAGPQILPELGESLGEYAARELRKSEVEIFVETQSRFRNTERGGTHKWRNDSQPNLSLDRGSHTESAACNPPVYPKHTRPSARE